MQTILQFIDDEFLYLIGINAALYFYTVLINNRIKSLNLLVLYVVLIYLNQALAQYYTETEGDNLFLFHIYLLIQFVCLSFFYKSLFRRKQKILVNITLLVVLILFLGYYYMWPKDFAYFNLPEILITTLPVLTYIFIHLYNSLSKKGDYLIFSGGLLIYLTISSFVFLLYALLVNDIDYKILDKQTTKNISQINSVSYMLMQIVIFIEWKLNISKWIPQKNL